MYDKHLDSFILVAEKGSFSKAAAEMYISTTALIKQVDILERELGVRLFSRTSRGVTLTDAGAFLYDRAKEIVAASQLAVESARKIENSAIQRVRLATSIMRPGGKVFDMWGLVEKEHPHIKLDIVQTSDSAKAWRQHYAGRSSGFDVLITIRPDGESWGKLDGLVIRDVYRSPMLCGIPKGHELLGRERLSLDDLSAHRVMFVRQGLTQTADDFRKHVLARFPDIEYGDYDPYDIDALNNLANGDAIGIISSEWAGTQPMLRCVPLEGGWFDRVCLVCHQDSPPAVLEFVEAMGALFSKSKPVSDPPA